MHNGITAIILAAGPGSRLLPKTLDTPKCLTPVAGQPILSYQLAALRQCGVRNIVMVVGYRSDRIRAYVDPAVTLVDNREFASTNSSYSLWLARKYLRGGFLHLNSDLIFEPDLLRALLAAPDENAVVVDRDVRSGSDMMKAEMNGRHILRMEKHLTDNAAAEVVGPAKFGPAGAELVVRRLSAARSRPATAAAGHTASSASWRLHCRWQVSTIPAVSGPKSIRRPMRRRRTVASPDRSSSSRGVQATPDAGRGAVRHQKRRRTSCRLL